MESIPAQIVFLDLPECTVVSMVTKDEKHEWVKLFDTKQAAAYETERLGLITAEDASALLGQTRTPALWSREVGLFAKATGRLGWMYFPGTPGVYH